MPIKPGDTIPEATLMIMGDAGPTPISSRDLLGGKTVVMFAVPGAFTPACSNQHLPGFVSQAEALRAKGVDSVICLAVNDVFVLDAWSRQQGAGGKVMMVSDGNGELTKKMGLELDASGLGLGLRTQRYAMLVQDGVVKQLMVEDNPARAERSGADAMLKQLG